MKGFGKTLMYMLKVLIWSESVTVLKAWIPACNVIELPWDLWEGSWEVLSSFRHTSEEWLGILPFSQLCPLPPISPQSQL